MRVCTGAVIIILLLSYFIDGATSQAVEPLDLDEIESNLSQCARDLMAVVNGEYPYYLKILDSCSKSINTMGNFDECNALGSDIARFCMLEMDSSLSYLDGGAIGACVPSSCDEAELQKLWNSLGSHNSPLKAMRLAMNLKLSSSTYNNSVTILEILMKNNFFGTSGTKFRPICHETRGSLTAGAWIMISVYIVFGLMMVLGSALDYFLPPKNPDGEYEGKAKLRQDTKYKLALAFSFQHNITRLIAPSPESSRFLDGIRTLSMFWVILGHTHSFIEQIPLFNPFSFYSEIWPTFIQQFVSGGYFAVDSFFFLSGFLGALALIKVFRKPVRPLTLPFLYLHRWLRLTPLYIVIIFTFSELQLFLGDGPLFYGQEKHSLAGDAQDNCHGYWWTNILYINNFIPSVDNIHYACVFWGWYLANDMQFFIFTPPLIWLYARYRKVAYVTCATIIALSMLASALIMALNNLEFGMNAYMDWYYIKPWSRVPCYFVGVLLALIWCDKGKINPAPPLKALLVVIGVGAIFAAVFSTYDLFRQTAQVLYFTFCRLSYGVGLAILSHLMLSGHLKPFRTLLSWSMWTPLARLTFGAYLVHPLVITAFYMSRRQGFNIDTWNITMHYIAFVVISYCCAFVLWMGVEKPFMNIFALLLPTRRRDQGEGAEQKEGPMGSGNNRRKPKGDVNILGSRMSMFINPKSSSKLSTTS